MIKKHPLTPWPIFVMLLTVACRARTPQARTVALHTPTHPHPPLAWSTATPTTSPTSTATSDAPTTNPTPFPSATAIPTLPPPTFTPTTDTVTSTLAPTPHARTPTLAPTPVPSPTTVPVTRVAVWEGTITINSYGWQDALVETTPDDPIYPYPRLDPGMVQPPAPRTYKTVVLENEYARLTFLPELGGRLYRWLDKPSGREMFYVNPVIKPTHWGARGWWLATGGIEWAFPVEEHGLVEWRPWRYQLARGANWASVTLSDQDDRTGLVVEVKVTLESGRSTLTIRPQVHNPTDTTQTFQFWLNGMVALSPANRPSPDLRFTLPGTSVIVHSTSDRGVPGVGEEMRWPIHDGRDMSRYGNWKGWLGVFATEGEYMGAYDPVSEMGVVRVFPAPIARGAKVFGPGNIDPGIWTDDGSGYVELWGGLTPTFGEDASLPPGGNVSWEERWYSLNGLGGLSYANDDAALWLNPGDGAVQVGTLSTAPMWGQLLLWHNDQVAATWQIATAPGSPFRASHPAEDGRNWGLQLLDNNGRSVAAYGTVKP